MKPEVSVIVPAYNSEDYLPKALESVFNQTYNNLEVILIDDASSDATVKIANSFNDKRLKIIKNQQNKGVSYSRNCGIKQAQGNWIALLDSDDWYAPDRLEKL
ncbi:MAG: glycosyltransferase family 2 protein, partial [Waterburya sp.]